MKKFISIVIVGLIILTIIPLNEAKGTASQETIAKKIIRFHVLANSDSKEDQDLKLKVRDKVLAYIAPKLSESKTLDESREILKANDAEIKKIAEAVIRQQGYKYSVTTTLGQDNFPVKQYGNITLPEGTYEAYRIVIGSGEGHNWWCVMFPPLCFVDITKGETATKETDGEMQQVLTPDEYKLVDSTESQDDITVKFKLVEICKQIFN